ncbi:MAG TPA: DUF4912 domain-containing protein [Opitutales bacterium]|nr:DUF4912 domain-containing protein [Opitutales bacterium]
MSEIRADLEKLQAKIEKSKAPPVDLGVRILPVSPTEFQARWSLDRESLESGMQSASHDRGETRLVLRAYSLPIDADPSDFSSIWHDYGIDSTDNSAYFTLPAPTARINAAVGLMNRSGRFSPLVRGEAVSLPTPPKEVPPKTDDGAKTETPGSTAGPPPAQAAAPDRRNTVALNEAEIAERLERIAGLPESFKSGSAASGMARTSQPSEYPQLLDEENTLKTVRQKMAVEPELPDPEPVVSPKPGTETRAQAESQARDGGSSEQLASQWEEIWSGKAPVEIRAEYVLTGKIAPGMKLLLGNEILAATPGGFIVWRRTLDSFNQVWPLLQAALSSPSVAAGPSLEFFREVNPSDRLLELHAALEIEGKVSDPTYHSLLPDELHPAADGSFKINRMLPDGAVILPGLSLIAG